MTIMKHIVKIAVGIFILAAICGCRKSSRGRDGQIHKVKMHTSAKVENTKPRNLGSSTPQIEKPVEKEEPIGATPSRQKLDGTEIFKKYNSAVFMIYTSDGRNGFQGSGFFISNNGLAVSNYHVFEGTTIGLEQIKLVDNSVLHVTEVVQKSSDEDFIIFKVNNSGPTNYIPIAASKPQIGEKVYAIGSPRGLENTFSSGEVSQWRETNRMQISALIDHGSSGGALINEYGEVIGITSGTFADGSQANLNYAWSIEAIKPYINQ